MKPLLLILFLLPLACFGQHAVDDSTLNAVAYKLLQDGNATEVISICRQFLHNNPKGKASAKAMYFMAEAYQLKKKNDSTLKYYKLALHPLTRDNYQHEACEKIAHTYILSKQYDSALSYLNLARNKYTFALISYEGYLNDFASIDMQSAQCYKALKQYENGISFLESYIKGRLLMGTNREMDSLYPLYVLAYGKEKVKTEFLNAPATIQVNIMGEDTGSETASAFLTLFGREVVIEHFPNLMSIFSNKDHEPMKVDDLKKEAADHFINSHIYKLATQ